MIKLGSVELNGSLGWSDRFSSEGVSQTHKRTLGGRLVVFAGPLLAGRDITLVAREDSGWLKHSVVLQLSAMSKVPGAIYTLIYGDETFRVMFNNSSPPSVDMQPIVPRQIHQPDDYFTGVIKLLTVE